MGVIIMTNLYLQNIVQSIADDSLPANWQDFDFVTFSESKKLFDFQQNALRNALKALHLFYKEKQANKAALFELYHDNGLLEDLSYTTKKDSKTLKYLEEYSDDYPEKNGKISFEYFINRMSFWMATGSGKTLVIVKLIEMLGELIDRGLLPEKDILFLTYRDDLLDQFKVHVDEFNSYHSDVKINLKNLKEYEAVKRANPIPFARNEITVFYYRSDLITDQGKEKQVDFRTYDNHGNWFIILDEAHKGDREESKRQMFYNILSRNGFLFNFSATFTDDRDFATCVYNYNLAEYVKNGYGKHVYLSSEDITPFRKNDDFTEIQKQKIILKILILHTIIKMHHEQIKQYDVYHNPLILTLVNSVNTEDSDLELFFKELADFAKNPTDSVLFNQAKNEVINEIASNIQTLFDDEDIEFNADIVKSVNESDVLQYVFNAPTNGNVEVLKLPGNKQELIFKLATSDKPFALIKIGDISEWLKNKLSGYTIIESFDNESYFKNINDDDSDINILMGSRSFYEGWDSNRPNIILFINIGTGTDARKFVLQSTGRGVRIQPVKDKRQRLIFLHNSGQIDKKLFHAVKGYYKPLETLFVFGTNAANLREIVETLKAEKKDESIGYLFDINPEIDKKKMELLIPVYKDSIEIIANQKEPQKFEINENDYRLVKNYFNLIGDKIAAIKFNPSITVLRKMKDAFNGQCMRYFLFNDTTSINNPELLLKKIFYHFDQTLKEFEKFKTLENEIIHFKHISVGLDHVEKLEEVIQKVKNYPYKEAEIQKLKEEFGKDKDLDKYTSQIENLNKNFITEEKLSCWGDQLEIKYLQNHYYIPVILSESEKIDYINHIIKVPGEVRFIEQLEKYLDNPDNVFNQFDWWMFSKIDETLDEVYIPYYNPALNKIAKFKPDFIFWLNRGSRYLILFVDPKGTAYTSYQHKVEGYKNMFKDKVFRCGEYEISVFLQLYTKNIADVGEEYREYWFDNFTEVAKKINEFQSR
ncbi:MAG: DEAD/DEAH box helicase family protein [Bacteroidales bacterium]